jgi:hypothetical protein
MSMTPEEGIRVVENDCSFGATQKLRDARLTVLSLARECLARRQKDSVFLNEKTEAIRQVLYELETELTLHKVWYVPGVITSFEKLRAKYCPNDDLTPCTVRANKTRSNDAQHQPDITTVLDDMHNKLYNLDYLSGTVKYDDVITIIEFLRKEYCSAPEPEEKPTLKGIVRGILCVLEEKEGRKWQGLLDQLEEVQE